MSKFISFIDEEASRIYNADSIEGLRLTKDGSMISILFVNRTEWSHFFFSSPESAAFNYERIEHQLID